MWDKRKPYRLLGISIFLIGTVIILLSPTLTVAMPTTAQQQLQRVWRQVQDIGQYQYRTSVLQTKHPIPSLQNVGRQSKTEQFYLEGAVDHVAEITEMTVRPRTQDNQRSVSIKVENGLAYGRARNIDPWTRLEDTTNLFTLGNNALGFLVAADNVQEIDSGQYRDNGKRFPPTVRLPSTVYQFDLDGLKYADYMREQMESVLLHNGDLPVGVNLDVNKRYVDMIGKGELWLDAEQRPLRQVIHLEFPPERWADTWIEAEITTEFSDWGEVPNIKGSVSDLRSLGAGLLARLTRSPKFTSRTLESSFFAVGMVCLIIGFVVLGIRYRRVPVFYGAFFAVLFFSMVVSPLIRANQVRAFNERQQAKAAENARLRAEQEQREAIRAEVNGRNFNPSLNPLASSPDAITLARDARGIDPAPLNRVRRTGTITYTTGSDRDNDGLTDDVELLELGTDPNDVDTDGDGISDQTEVTGFSVPGSTGYWQTWYLDPSSLDSNGDGISDYSECPDLVDVDEDGVLGTPPGTTCPDTDGDDVPDVFDFDNDGDGVPDKVDSSFNDVGYLKSQAHDEITLSLSGYETGRMLFVDFELRPIDEEHLWYTNNVLDWPTDDSLGQVRRMTDTTLDDDGDIVLNPVLEIALPYAAANPSRSLPVSPTVDAGGITATTPITAWLDQETLDGYSISVTQDGEMLYAYIPLNVIKNDVGEMPVAWSARMPYLPESTTWGTDHQVRMVWLVNALVDTCDTSTMADGVDYDTHCADSENWTSETQVIQTYYENFYVTSLSVREDYGMQAAVIAQTDALAATHENYLWHLADTLQQTFIAGDLVDTNGDDNGDVRFDLAQIEARFDNDSLVYADGAPERWGIPKSALDVRAVYTYPDQITGLDGIAAVQVPAALSQYANPDTDARVTLLLAREETFKSIDLSSDDVTVTINGQVTVDLGEQITQTYASVNWSPYVYDGYSWDADDLGDTLAHLDTHLAGVIDVSALLDGGTTDDVALAELGAISLAKNYYLAVYQGVTDLVVADGFTLSEDTVVDDDLLLSTLSAETLIVDDMLTLIQSVYEEESLISFDGKALAAEAIQTFVSKGKLLESLGEIDTGVVTLVKQTTAANSIFKKLYKSLYNLSGTSSTTGKIAKKGAKLTSVATVSLLGYGLGNGLDGNELMLYIYSLNTGSALLEMIAALNRLGVYHRYWGFDLKIPAVQIKSNIEEINRFGLVMTLVFDISISLGFAVFAMVSQNIEFGSPQFYTLLALTFAQIAVTILMVAISATIVGAAVVALISLIDAVMGLICQLTGLDADENWDTWFCNGITGALTQAFTYLIFDYTPLVDMSRDDRLSMTINNFTLNTDVGQTGFVVGNSVDISAIVTSSLYMNSPNWMGYIYGWQLDDDYLEESTFVYKFQEEKKDLSVSLNQTSWDIPDGRSDEVWYDAVPNGVRFYKTVQPTYTYMLETASVNHGFNLYLSEGFVMNAQHCWLIITDPVCWLEDYEDTYHIDLSENFIFDVLPNSIRGFHELALVKDDSYRLAWHDYNPVTLADADNDGLRSKARGGVDPDDSVPDADSDGLSDYWEYYNGFDPENGDSDCDGLTDYWEAFYQTDPFQTDTDNDGLRDADEVFHRNWRYPYERSALSTEQAPTCAGTAAPWIGGWDIIYDYHDTYGFPFKFRVSADPTDGDSDDDDLPDGREYVYGYNPNVARDPVVLSLDTTLQIGTGFAPYVASGGVISYTANISNELDNRYAYGLLQAEFPVDTVVSNRVIETLRPLQSITMTGAVDVAASSTSYTTSLALRSGALINEGTGRVLWLRFNEQTGSEFADASLHNNNATCDPCPQLTGEHLIFEDGGSLEDVVVDTSGGDFDGTAFSVGGWVYPTNTGDGWMFEDSHYQLYLDGLIPQVNVRLTNGVQLEAKNVSVVLNQNTWNHLMFTFSLDDALNAQVKLYHNGELIASDAHTGESLRYAPSELQMGWLFDGYLDDIEVYARALTDAEIDAMINVPILDVDFESLSDLSNTRATVACSGDRCPSAEEQLATFDQTRYVHVSDSALDLSQGQFSFAAWMKPEIRAVSMSPDFKNRSAFTPYLIDSDYDWQGVFGSNTTGQSDYYPTLYVSEVGHLWMGFKKNGTLCEYKTTKPVVSIDAWQHVIVTFDPTRRFTVYVDGEQKAQGGSTACSSVTPPNLSTFTIGRPNSHAYLFFGSVEPDSIDDANTKCEELYFKYDGSQIWSGDVCARSGSVSGISIFKYRFFADDNAHTFQLMEEDSWPNPDDTYLDETFYNYEPFRGGTYYDDWNSEGYLYWYLNNDYFQGQLDQFRLYDHDMSADEAVALYNTSLAALEQTFDEPPGVATFGDVSGNGFFSTCDWLNSACPDSGIPGRDNQALRFDGGVADDGGFDGVADYVTIEADTDSLGLYDASFSVMAWVKADDLSGDRAILGTDTTASREGLHLILRNGRSYMGFYGADTASSANILTGRWYHLAWVYDKAAQTQKLYVNGNLAGTGKGKPSFLGTVEVRIGRALGGNNFDGLIDDLLIVRRAVGGADVQAAMNAVPLVNLHLDEDFDPDIASFKNDSLDGRAASCYPFFYCPESGDKGQVREAAIFDGNDTLELDPAEALNLSDFTYALWLKPEHMNYETATLVKGVDDADHTLFALQAEENGSLDVTVSRGVACTAEYTLTSDAGLLVLHQWQHIMVTSKDNVLTLYFNGSVKETRTDLSTETCSNYYELELGEGLIGDLDEVTLYGTALDDPSAQAFFAYQNAWYDVVETHDVTVDADVPDKVYLDLHTTHISATTQVMSIVADDPTSPIVTVSYQLDGGAWLAATADGEGWYFTYDAIVPGAHAVAIRATDAVGHVSDVVTHNVYVDGAPPVLTVDSSLTSGPVPADPSLVLHGILTDTESGLADTPLLLGLFDRYGASVSGLKAATVSASTWYLTNTFPNPPYGTYTLLSTAQDAVGNTITESHSLQLDGYGPYADVMLSTSVITQGGTVISGTVGDVRHLPSRQRLHLHFEEGVGTVAFSDSSTNHFTVTCSSVTCPTARQSGKLGRALDFDGTDDALTIEGVTAISVTEHVALWDSSFTVMAWVSPSTLTGDRAVLGTDTAVANEGLFLGLRDGAPYLGFTSDDLAGTDVLATGQWTHLAWRYDNDSGEQAIFINGALHVTRTATSAFAGRGDLHVGRAWNGNPYAGLLDDLVIYSGALSEDTIYDIANPLPVNVSQLQLRLRHAEDMEQDADDGLWYDLTLDTPDASFSTWHLALASNLEGPYRIDLKATDELGNVAVIRDAWTGDIDTMPPRLTFAFERYSGSSNLTSVECAATDYNLTRDGWECPIGEGSLITKTEDAAWMVDKFGVTDKLTQLIAPEEIIVTSTIRSEMTSCDLVGHCATKSTIQSPGGTETGLALWIRTDTGVDASGGLVADWQDLSLNDQRVSQSNSMYQPAYVTNTVNGYPVVRFDGTGDVLSSTLPLDPAAGFSLWLVARPDSVHDGTLLAQQNGNMLLAFTSGGEVSSAIDGASHLRNNAYTGDTGNPALYGLSYDGAGLLAHTYNGVNDGSESGLTVNSVSGSWVVGSAAGMSSHYLDGDITEVIIYTGTLDADTHAKIDSYLALKYGVTLSNTQNYVDSTGVTLWEAAWNSAYYNDVAGIGRDNNSGLVQFSASSSNADAVVTMEVRDTPIIDQDFLLWGNDDGSLFSTTPITINWGASAGLTYERLGRLWRVQKSGSISETTVTFDLSGLGLDVKAQWVALLRATASDLSDATLRTRGASVDGDVVSFSGVEFAHNDIFTLIIGPSPVYSVYTKVPEALDYTRIVYALDIPSNADYSNSDPDYFIDNAARIGPYDRVAYYLELITGTTTTWAYVSMPAFTVNPAYLGVPTYASGAVFEQTVSDMVVDANVSGIVTGAVSTGNLEFWPYEYAPGANSGLGGSDVDNDFDDTHSGSNNYGSLQIHNYGAGQTLMAWNSWGNNNVDDIGLGNAPDTNTDWTGLNNSDSYTERRLFVLARYGAIANNDAYTTAQALPLVVDAPGVLANDSLSITAVLLTDVDSGVLQFESDGAFVYTPTISASGDVTFAYTINDGVVTDTAIVTLTLTPASCFAEIHGDTRTDFASADSSAVQAAIDAVASGSTIKVAGTCAGVQTVYGETQVAHVNKTLTLQGGYEATDILSTTGWLAEPNSKVHTTTLDAQSSGRVVYVSNGDVTLSQLNLTNGQASFRGGGIYNAGTLTVSQSTVADNQASATSEFAGKGGGIYSIGPLTVLNTTFSNNNAVSGGSLDSDSKGGGVYNSKDGLVIKGNTFVGNQADVGSAICNWEAEARVINNTLNDNSGGYAFYSLNQHDWIYVYHNTIAGNQNGGFYLYNSYARVYNNILFNNSGSDCVESGGFVAFRGNIAQTGDTDCRYEGSTEDPQLGSLTDNGGDTWTMAITSDSSAYNASPNYLSRYYPATDQRGVERPRGPLCDVGAYEAEYVDIELNKAVAPAYPQAGDTITYTLTFINNSIDETLTGVVITDAMPVEVFNVTHTVALDPGVVITYTASDPHTWDVSDLLPGQGGAIILTGTVDAGLTIGTYVTNTATITASEHVVNGDNNTAVVRSLLCVSQVITVTNADDSGPGSLRQAITDLCEGGMITFDDDYTIYLSSTLTLDRDGVTIDGSSHHVTISGDSGGDGDRDVRVFDIKARGVVTLSHLSIVGGYVVGRGGGIYNEGWLTLEDSTLSDNEATGSPTGGAALANRYPGTAILRNTTATSNATPSSIYNDYTMTLTHVTIANNISDGLENWGDLYLYNSILAGNGGDDCSNISSEGAEIFANDSNIVEDGSCNEGALLTGYLDVDPLLGTFDYHGGDTRHYDLQPGSPAIATADSTYCLDTDQRGVSRLYAPCDRGTYEVAGVNLRISQHVTPTLLSSGEWGTYTVAFSNTGSITATGIIITGVLPSALVSNVSVLHAGVSITPTGTVSYTWTVADMAPGDAGVLTVTGVLTGGGIISNTVTITGTETDIQSVDNTATTDLYLCGGTATVLTDADSGYGSLRDILALVCNPRIIFASDVTVYLSSTLEISHAVMIDGSGHDIVISGDRDNDGTRDLRPFTVHSSAAVTLSHLSIVSGTASMGGGIYNDGALALDTVTLNGHDVPNATSTDWGGGVYNSVTGTLTVKNSTFVNNTADDSGGAIYNNGTLTVSNSTFYSNYGVQSGSASVLDNNGSATLNNNTISGNDTGEGYTLSNAGDLVLRNTIIANNTSFEECGSGGTLSSTHNLIDDNTCSAMLTDPPSLGTPDISGATLVLPLLSDSPAIDVGAPATCETIDQRGYARPQGAVCDLGAYELTRPVLTIAKLVTPTHVPPGGTLTYTLLFTNVGDGDAEAIIITDTLPTELVNTDYSASHTVTHTLGTTYVWTVSDTLGTGESAIITVTAQLTSPLALDALTNTDDIASTVDVAYVVTATTDVSFTVRNGAPVMGTGVFTISEGASEGLAIGSVTGMDANLDVLTYTLVDGNDWGIFDIYTSTGQLVVSETEGLNYEARDEHILTVAASDGVLSGTNVVTIYITDEPADLSITKSVTPLLADPGEAITYTLVFTNGELDTASDTVIVDESLGHLATFTYTTSLDSAVAITRIEPITYVWLLGDLGSDVRGMLTVTGILSEPLAWGAFTNTAIISTTTTDSNDANNAASASVTVNNIAPVVHATVLTVSETQRNGSVIGYVDACDANGDPLTYTLDAGNGGGAFVLDGETGQITIADVQHLVHEITSQFVLTVNVAQGAWFAAVPVTITVLDVAPDWVVTKVVTPHIGVPGSRLTYTLSFSNAGGATLDSYVTITDFIPSHITVQDVISRGTSAITRATSTPTLETFLATTRYYGDGGTITLTAVINEPAAGVFTNTAVISEGTTETMTENNLAEAGVRVQNVTPVLEVIPSQGLTETALFTLTLVTHDVNGDVLSFGLLDAPSGVTVMGNIVTWIPSEAQGPGTYTFTVVVSDTEPLTDSQRLILNVLDVNSAPILAPIGEHSITEGRPLTLTLTATDADVPTNTLAFSLDAGAPSGVTLTSGGDFTWTPTEAQGPGVYTLTARVTDDGIPPLMDTEIFTITVLEANVPPVAHNDAYSTAYGTTLVVSAFAGVLNNDMDVESLVLTATLVQSPSDGDVTLDADGAFVYTPTVGFSGQDTFTYRASDGTDVSNLAYVTLTVGGAPTYTLAVNVVGQGAVTRVPDQVDYIVGTIVTLIAAPDPGWQFAGWDGDLNSTLSPITLTLSADKGVTATFVTAPPITHTLTVHTVGLGFVTPESGAYISGTVVTLRAIADLGWKFDGWSGAVISTTTPITLAMNGHKVITATFSEIVTRPPTVTLTVNIVGHGTVTPTGGSYISGTRIFLRAIPDTGWQFVGWSGALTGVTTSISLTMDTDKVITATFAIANPVMHTLTVSLIGEGLVSRVPSATTYISGTVVSLAAIPEVGWQFDSWGGDLQGGVTPISLTVNSSKAVIATFSQTGFKVYLPLILRIGP